MPSERYTGAVQVVPKAVVHRALRRELVRKSIGLPLSGSSLSQRFVSPDISDTMFLQNSLSPPEDSRDATLPSEETLRRVVERIGPDLLGANLLERFRIFSPLIEPEDLQSATMSALAARIALRMNHLAGVATFLVVRQAIVSVASVHSQSVLPEEPVAALDEGAFDRFLEELARRVADSLLEPTDPLLPLPAIRIRRAGLYRDIRDDILRDVLKPILDNRRDE